MNQNKSYYSHFNTTIFLGAKELLKSMPALYTRVYFSTKYVNALVNGDTEEEFINVTILTEMENIEMMRNIIKNNFLYINDWDSQNFTENLDYGFSFIAGNVKYVLLPFTETETGYVIRSFDVDTGDCYETNLSTDKTSFLNVTLRENGDFIRTANFNLENMNENNTNKFTVKKSQPDQIIVENNRGYALTNFYAISFIALLCVLVVWITAQLFKIFVLP